MQIDLPVRVPKGPVTADLLKQTIEAVRRAEAQIPDGKNGVVVAVIGHEAASIVGVSRLGKIWTIEGEVSRRWSGKVSGQLRIIGTW